MGVSIVLYEKMSLCLQGLGVAKNWMTLSSALGRVMSICKGGSTITASSVSQGDKLMLHR